MFLWDMNGLQVKIGIVVIRFKYFLLCIWKLKILLIYLQSNLEIRA